MTLSASDWITLGGLVLGPAGVGAIVRAVVTHLNKRFDKQEERAEAQEARIEALVEQIHTMSNQVQRVVYATENNGGGSMKDSIDQGRAEIKEMAVKLDAHMIDAAARGAVLDILATQAGLPIVGLPAVSRPKPGVPG